MPGKPLNGPDDSHQATRRPLEELQATALLREGDLDVKLDRFRIADHRTGSPRQFRYSRRRASS